MTTPRRLEAAWLTEGALARVLATLDGAGEEARLVGGTVRNALLGEPFGDADIATTALPVEVIRRVEAAGFTILSAVSPISKRAGSASSATRRSALPKITSVSCGFSASMRPTARARSILPGCTPASRRAAASIRSRASACEWNSLSCSRRPARRLRSP